MTSVSTLQNQKNKGGRGQSKPSKLKEENLWNIIHKATVKSNATKIG